MNSNNFSLSDSRMLNDILNERVGQDVSSIIKFVAYKSKMVNCEGNFDDLHFQLLVISVPDMTIAIVQHALTNGETFNSSSTSMKVLILTLLAVFHIILHI